MKKLLLVVLSLIAPLAARAEPLRVCATVPDLGDLVREIGGAEVEVTVFAKGVEDPHFVEARPSFIRALNRADLFIQVGLELDVGWAPVLLQNANNPRVQPGQPGFLDASRVIAPMDVPQGVVDRSMGDVHPGGNPHYLVDPRNGLKVADLIRDRLGELRPEQRAAFDARAAGFRSRLETARQAGLDQLKPLAGTSAVADHNMWPYFADCYGIEVAAFLEPKPGMPPTTRHLQDVIALMKRDGVRLVLASPYYDPRHAKFVSAQTGARIVPLAHQVGSRPGADTYLEMIAYNVRQLAEAIAP
jgi:ABC-type Zn uptake system ZnuABC Zn-binding protein ZnuA